MRKPGDANLPLRASGFFDRSESSGILPTEGRPFCHRGKERGMQQEYQKLGMAILRQSCRDLIRFSGARNRREYRSARRFLDSALFDLICRSSGANPGRTRELILRHAESVRGRGTRPGRTQVAEDRPVYRARRVIGIEARSRVFGAARLCRNGPSTADRR